MVARWSFVGRATAWQVVVNVDCFRQSLRSPRLVWLPSDVPRLRRAPSPLTPLRRAPSPLTPLRRSSEARPCSGSVQFGCQAGSGTTHNRSTAPTLSCCDLEGALEDDGRQKKLRHVKSQQKEVGDMTTRSWTRSTRQGSTTIADHNSYLIESFEWCNCC